MAVVFLDAEVRAEAVMEYQGIFQLIRAFRRAISACGAREAETNVRVPGVQVGQVANLLSAKRAAAACRKSSRPQAARQ